MKNVKQWLPVCLIGFLTPGGGVAANPPADLIVRDGGSVLLRSELTLNDGDVVVENGGIFRMTDDSTLNALRLFINQGGILVGCGTINADITNEGLIRSDCGPGGNMAVNGTLLNSGYVAFCDGTTLDIEETLTNSGRIFVHGSTLQTQTVINSGFIQMLQNCVNLLSAQIDGADFRMSVLGKAGYQYQIQVSDTLKTPDWVDLGGLVDGIEGPMDLVAPNEGVNPDKRFFRIREIAPPIP